MAGSYGCQRRPEEDAKVMSTLHQQLAETIAEQSARGALQPNRSP